ncbi:hypothetical protein KIW84_014426 [Lathyrus oleraceus]|uniref:RRM domain-containing protein n=1 Tax=Pisum sativum TaxID=3888 RepID=A0A9D5GZ73_PEA|nr:hypothetical protein KIW84_014426 [Pisum sativum]
MVLETLQEAVKAGHESPALVERVISPVIVNVWASHVLDPFISIDALEVLEAIKSIPGCIHPLVSRILPHIGPILNKPKEQADGLVAGSLDLVTMLLKNSPGDVVKAIYKACFDAVIRIILQSDEHSEIQNAMECLSAFYIWVITSILLLCRYPGKSTNANIPNVPGSTGGKPFHVKDVNVASSLSTDNDIFDILPQAKKRKFFMKNLDETFDSRALHDTFSTVGHILFCEMATVGSGRSKGFSFAQLENAEPAKNAN